MGPVDIFNSYLSLPTHLSIYEYPKPELVAQEEVQGLVRLVQPRHLVVELCPARRARLEAQRLTADSCSILPAGIFESDDFMKGIKAGRQA